MSGVVAALTTLEFTTAAVAAPPPGIEAKRVQSAPVIDGQLNESAWAVASVSVAFTQEFPEEGAAPSEATALRVLYDDDNLYVGIDCPQIHSPIVSRLQRRDGQLPSDGVSIDIDSRGSRVGAFHFAVNAAGVLGDGLRFNDTEYSSDWDAVWEARVAPTDHGYAVEMRIPLAALRFSDTTGTTAASWGLQVKRFIDARQEIDDWALVPRSAGTLVPLFGHLDGLTGLNPRRAFELRPFVLGRAGYRATPTDGTLTKGRWASASAGVDAKVQLSNELTLDLAVLPDFGQVEPDSLVLNLSTFETFFPEKRPFFLEGTDVFSSLRPLFYSRRIGHQPLAPMLAPGERLVAIPGPSVIASAAKVSGTIGGRTTVGIASALTGGNEVQVEAADGSRHARLAEPWTAYSALRLKRLVLANGEVGFFVTATNRFEPNNNQPCDASNPSASSGRCTNDAYAMSVDGRWRSPSGDYSAAWQAIGSTLVGGPARAQPDGLPIRPGHLSGGASLNLGKDGGLWLVSATQSLSGRELELNDLGYLERKNDYLGLVTLTRRTVAPWWRTVEAHASLQVGVRRSLDGLDLGREVNVSSEATFTSFWSITGMLRASGASFDDREMGDGSALEHPTMLGGFVLVSSDPRRFVFAYGSASVDRHANGMRLSLDAQLTVRLSSRFQLDLLPTASRETGVPRFVGVEAIDQSTSVYFFGRQASDSLSTTLRAAYTFTPQLSLQAYAQVFVANVRYGPFFSHDHVNGQRERVSLNALTPVSADSASVASISELRSATFNANVVLRWEYRPGSTLFLVYTRSQVPALGGFGGAAFATGSLLRGRDADDVVMFKLLYWWG